MLPTSDHFSKNVIEFWSCISDRNICSWKKTLITQDKKMLTAFPIRTDFFPYQLNPHFPFSYHENDPLRIQQHSAKTREGWQGMVLQNISHHDTTRDLLMDTKTSFPQCSRWSQVRKVRSMLFYDCILSFVSTFKRSTYLCDLDGHHVSMPFADKSGTVGKTAVTLT